MSGHLYRGRLKGHPHRNETWLKNRIITHLNEWRHLGCDVMSADRFFARGEGDRKRKFRHFIIGCAKDGRMILLYPIAPRRPKLLKKVAAELMDKWASRGALVGCCTDIGDAYDIVIDDPIEYPRKRRTYFYERCLAHYTKEDENE